MGSGLAVVFVLGGTMTTKIGELPPALKALNVYVIARDAESPALIDGAQNSTGHDMIPVFSSSLKAAAYRDKYPSLRGMDIYATTMADVEKILCGKVEYFIVDR
jgi:hypothetical protein